MSDRVPTEQPEPPGLEPEVLLQQPLVQKLIRDLAATQASAAAARWLGQVALVAAILSVGVSAWAVSGADAAAANCQGLTQELNSLRDELRGAAISSPGAEPKQPRAADPSASAADPTGRDGFSQYVLFELRDLEEQIASNRVSAESGLFDWGTETKQYVEERVNRLSADQGRQRTEDQRLRATEMNEVWAAIGRIQTRLGVR